MKQAEPTRQERRGRRTTGERGGEQDALGSARTLSEEPTWDDPSAEPADKLERGAVLGRYVVLDVLGEGGMGVVYSAYDPDLDRRVALKLLHAPTTGSGDSGHSARLLREAQALARLSHPNVVGVYDVGRVGDRVFVAMEHVDGPSLKAWLKERDRSWREILEVFLDAGRGLAAAHASGLVHRDIKPDNVFLWLDGRVCIGDFGLARSAAEGEGGADAAEAEAAGDEVEADPDVDEVATVAAAPGAGSGSGSGRAGSGSGSGSGRAGSGSGSGSGSGRKRPASGSGARSGSGSSSPLATPLTATGTLLGTPPYMSPEQHRAQPTDHRTDQFSFCATLYEALYRQRAFAGEGLLDVRKSILAGAVREPPKSSDVPPHVRRALLRGLESDPARRYPSMQELLADLGRDPAKKRRRIAASSVAIAAAAAVVGLVATAQSASDLCSGGAAELAKVWNAERRQLIAASFSASGLSAASTAWARTAEILDGYGQKWATMHRDACEATRVRGEQSERLLDARMLCLDRRRAELDSLAGLLAEAKDDPALVRAAVDAALSLSSIDACADQEALLARVPPPDDPEVRAQVEEIERGLARTRATLTAGRNAEAAELAADLVARAGEVGFEPILAEAELQLGIIERLAGDIDAAEQHLFDAALHAESSRADDTAAKAWIELVLVIGRDRARYEDGLLWARVAAAAIDRLGDAPELRSLLHNDRGAVLDARGDFEASAREYEAALAIDEEVLGADDPNRAITLANLGSAHYRLGRYDQARDHYERALAIRVASYGAGHPKIAESKVHLAIVLEAQGDLDAALAAYEEALAINERVFGPEALPVADTLSSIGGTYHALGRHEDALAANRRALAIRRAALGPEHPDLGQNHNNIAIALKNLGRYDDAITAYETALGLFVRAHGERAFSVAITLNNIGEVFRVQGKCDEALDRYQRSLDILAEQVGAEHPVLAHPLTGLGACQVDLGRPARAVPLLERALALREAAGVGAVELAETRFALARALGGRGADRARARELAEAARSAYASAGEGRAHDLAAVDAWLARR